MIEMHIDAGFPLYNAEARQRMYTYEPPYNGGYATPWLWYDGDQHGSYQYWTWESKILARMNQPAPVTVTMWGDYTPSFGNGTVYAQFRNDSTAAINGRVIFVITEDSLYYAGPNGDIWHNHVARDYLPNVNGQSVNIPAGDSVTVSQAFTIQSGWNEDKCEIVAFIQNPNMQADSTKEVWQGNMVKVTDFIGIEEENSEAIFSQKVNAIPNPCVNGTAFNFELPVGMEYQIDIFDVTGRHVSTLKGVSSRNQESIKWHRRDDTGSEVGSGVYLYRFESKVLNSSGKIVVR